jgi:hypothetical protein
LSLYTLLYAKKNLCVGVDVPDAWENVHTKFHVTIYNCDARVHIISLAT